MSADLIVGAAEAEAVLTAPGARFETATAVVDGRTVRVWKNAPADLRAVLAQSLTFGDRDFLVYEETRLTYDEHYAQVARLAHLLRTRFGVEKGDRVAIAMRNYPEWSVAFFAAAAIGAIVVPLNAWWTGAELAYGLNDSGAVLLIADSERAARLVPAREGLDLRAVLVARGLADGALSLDDELATVPEQSALPAVDLEPDDPATIFYTSGTTGFPKGAFGSHRNICNNVLSVGFAPARVLVRRGEALPDPETVPQRAILLSVPMFHVTGCHSVLVAGAFGGAKVVLMHRWDPEDALRLIAAEQVNVFGGVPSMAWQVLESPAFSKYDTSSLEGVSYGGAPAAPELVETIGAAVPVAEPGNGWGMTETSSVATHIVGAEYRAKPQSVGRPVAVCDVKTVDDDGQNAPAGQLGELMIAGPNVVKGYWNKPEATAAAFVGGWVRTGDIGWIDEEGFVHVVDRAKDMIIRAGENIYCVEVENVLFEHDAVIDAAIIGLADRILGEEVGAVVQVKPGETLTAAALIEYAAARLAAFKVPIAVEIRSEPLPRNANGKILKDLLREQFQRTEP